MVVGARQKHIAQSLADRLPKEVVHLDHTVKLLQRNEIDLRSIIEAGHETQRNVEPLGAKVGPQGGVEHVERQLGVVGAVRHLHFEASLQLYCQALVGVIPEIGFSQKMTGQKNTFSRMGQKVGLGKMAGQVVNAVTDQHLGGGAGQGDRKS